MAKEALVFLEGNNRKVAFSGSSMQLKHLIAAIGERFEDVLRRKGGEISHLQMWDKDYEEYVDIEDVTAVQNKCKIKAVLKVLLEKALG